LYGARRPPCGRLYLEREEQAIHTADEVRDARELERPDPDLEPPSTYLPLETVTDASLKS